MGSPMNVHEIHHVVANGLSAVLTLPEEALERQFGLRPSEVQDLRLFVANAGIKVETAHTPLPPDRQDDSTTLSPRRAKNPWGAVKGLVHATSFLKAANNISKRSTPPLSPFKLSGRDMSCMF
jgi:hypothetical protein